MLKTGMTAAVAERAEPTQMTIVGEDDEFVVARWLPGILPALAEEVGFEGPLVDLPAWLRFPANATAGSIVYPAFDFLARMARNRGDAAKETCVAYAYDLRSWFEFLAMEQTSWSDVTQATAETFVDDMVRAQLADDDAHPDEGAASTGSSSNDASLRPGLAQATIKRRIATLSSFYRHALSTDKVPFSARTGYKTGGRPLELVRPIPLENLETFVECLGTRPSQWKGFGTSRLWCCAILALVAGLRRIEVCGLDVDQILALRIDPRDRMASHGVSLRVTKGGRQRPILLPTWLVTELLAYIEGERGASTSPDGSVQPLFVNHAHARRAPGSRLAPSTLSLDFRNAMVAADMRRMHLGFKYGTGASSKLHTFHDLRHTCACLLYFTYSDSQNPWLEVQNRLGHRLLRTTTEVYLRHINEVGARAGDLRQSLVDGMLLA